MKKLSKIISAIVAINLVFSQALVLAEDTTVSSEGIIAEITEYEQNSNSDADTLETDNTASEVSAETTEEKTQFGPETFVKGKKNTFYAVCWWPRLGVELENLNSMYWDIGGNEGRYGFYQMPDQATLLREVKALIEHTKNQPEGRIGFCYNRYPNTLTGTDDYKSSGLWLDAAERAAERLDQILTLYKRMGGPEINMIAVDNEDYTIPTRMWANGLGIEETFDRMVNDPRYLTEIRPELERLGFEFCYEEGKNELFYGYSTAYTHDWEYIPDKSWQEDIVETGDDLRPGGIADNSLKLHAVMSNYMDIGIYEAVYEVAKKHYPDAIVGNYNSFVLPEEKGTHPLETQGYVFGYTRRIKAGNVSSTESYGYNYMPSLGEKEVFKDYPWETLHPTIFNGLRGDLIQNQISAIYTQDNRLVPWIGNYSWRWGLFSPAQTRYWDETVFHYMMTNSLPFYWHYTETGEGPSDDYHLSELLYELDEVLGFEDRKLLIEKPMSYKEHYILSGNYAGGRNVWRITPDLSYTDFEIEDFLYDEEKMIFKIGNQFIDFPDESYIYYSDTDFEHRTISMFGYWVISPEGTRPVEYVDENFEPMGEPDIVNTYSYHNVAEFNEKQDAAYARYLARKNQK